jgi:hypothetical protein
MSRGLYDCALAAFMMFAPVAAVASGNVRPMIRRARDQVFCRA